MSRSEIEQMGWREKLDKLELDADPGLVPLIVSLRADMELMSAVAARGLEAERIVYEIRKQLLDLIAVRQEHRANV
jgi:hypothetical protein